MTVPTVDSVARPQVWGYDGYLGNVLFRLAVNNSTQILEQVTAPVSPPRVDTAEGPEDIRDEVGQRYSRTDLRGGAGLDFMHTPTVQANAPTRFWDSRGVEIFDSDRGKPYGVKLQHDVVIRAVAPSASFVRIDQIDGTIYHMFDEVLYEYPSTLRNTFTAVTMRDMVVLGNTLYFLDGTDGVSRILPPTWTPVSVSTIVYDQIWAVKGRIVGRLDNDLWEIVDGASDILVDSLATGETVTDIIDVHAAVLAFCSDQTVRAYTINSAQNLSPAGITPTKGEIPLMAVYTQGIIGYATRALTSAGGQVIRFYTAELDVAGQFTLTNQQLVYQLGDRTTTKDISPNAIYATRDSIYLAAVEEDSDNVTFWRYYLPTKGYARDLELTFDSVLSVSSLVEVDDRFYIGVPTSGIWVEDDDFVSVGYFIGPLADHFTAEPKQWVAGRLTGEQVPASATLELYDSTNPGSISDPDSNNWQLVVKLVGGQNELEIDTLSGRNTRFHTAKVVLRSDTGKATSPEFRSYSFRSLPNPNRDVLIRIPINVSDQFESPGKRRQVTKGRGAELEVAIRAFEGRHTILELYRVSVQVRGLVERVETPIEQITEQGSVTRVQWVTMRGKRIQDSKGFGSSTLGASLGQDTAGLFMAGIGVPT